MISKCGEIHFLIDKSFQNGTKKSEKNFHLNFFDKCSKNWSWQVFFVKNDCYEILKIFENCYDDTLILKVYLENYFLSTTPLPPSSSLYISNNYFQDNVDHNSEDNIRKPKTDNSHFYLNLNRLQLQPKFDVFF